MRCKIGARTYPLFLICLVCLCFFLSGVLERRGLKMGRFLYVLPRDFIRLVSGTHKAFVADLFYLKALQFIGERNPGEGERALKEEEVDYLLGNLRIVSALDPKFISPYFMGGVAITYDRLSTLKAIQFLEEARVSLPQEWRIPFWIGFNYYHHLDMPEKALTYIDIALKVPDAPPYLKRIQPMLYYKAGKSEEGIAYLEGLISSIDNPRMKEWVEKKLMWLRSTLYLQNLVDRFKEKFERLPDNLEELKLAGFLDEIPKDSFGKDFYLDRETGLVKSTFGRSPPPMELEKTDLSQQIEPERGLPGLLYFYSRGCNICKPIDELILRLKARYNIAVAYKDLSDPKNRQLLLEIWERYGVHTVTPLVEFEGQILSGQDILVRLENLIKVYKGLTTQVEAKGVSDKIKADEVEGRAWVWDRFKKIGSLSILMAGLVDGINPCAFSVLVFLIAYLSFIKKSGREVLLVGIAFSAAVFISYLLIGLGIFDFIRRLDIFPNLHLFINYGISFTAIMLGCLSLWDYFLLKQGRLKEVKLRLGEGLKQKIQLSITRTFRFNHFLYAAIASGFLISVFELTCTGQIYLPTIVLIDKTPSLKRYAPIYLILYNLMFILPLILVFLVVFFGSNSENVSRFFKTHLATSKLLATLMFFALGVLLLI